MAARVRERPRGIEVPHLDGITRIGHNAAVSNMNLEPDDPNGHPAVDVWVRGDPKPEVPQRRVDRRTALAAGIAGVGVAVLGAVAVPKLFGGKEVAGEPLADSTPVPGQIRWRAAIPVQSDMHWSPPAVADGSVFATTQSLVVAFDTMTGQTRWRADAGGEISRGPAIAADVVIVQTVSSLMAFDRATGARRWQTDDATTTGILCVSAQSGVVYAFASGRPYIRGVCALDARTGRMLWTARTDGAESGPLGIGEGAGTVAAVDNDILFALDPATGAIRWRTSIRGYMANPFVGPTAVATIGAAGVVEAFDIATGAPLWTFKANQADYATMHNDLVYVGGGHWYGGYSAGRVQSIDLRTGRSRWAAGATGAPPVYANTTIFTADKRKVCALDAATGAQKWECDVVLATSAVAAHGDSAYAYGSDHLYAIRL